MAMPFTQVPTHPNVPRSPGVPPVLQSPTQAPIFAALLLLADALIVLRWFLPPQWGLFNKKGELIFDVDSTISFEYRREMRIADYPVEEGGFMSYDKVQSPQEGRIKFAIGGAAETRKAFLDALDFAAKSLDLYDLVSPDATYPNMNITHYDYRREARNGAALLIVDVWVQEVRIVEAGKFTETKKPEGEAEKNTGTVQPQDAKPKASQRGEAMDRREPDVLPPGAIT